MTALQWIVKEAKKIKKEYPKRFAKWTDYVAQASAIYAKKHKGHSPVGKKKAKVGAVKKKAAVKNVAHKKPHKKSPARSLHKDTKSHNVKISVMSGVKKENLEQIRFINQHIEKWRKMMYLLEDELFHAKTNREKMLVKRDIREAKYNLKTLEETLKDFKKLIK